MGRKRKAQTVPAVPLDDYSDLEGDRSHWGSEDDDAGADQEYVVEGILAAKVAEEDEVYEAREGDWIYWVKWERYKHSRNSWEPHGNLGNCSKLLTKFWDHVGNKDHADYPVGTILQAKKSWAQKLMRKERKTSASIDRQPKEVPNTIAPNPWLKREQSPSSYSGKKHKRAKLPASSASVPKAKRRPATVETDSSDDDTPLMQRSASASKIPPSKKQKITKGKERSVSEETEREQKEKKKLGISNSSQSVGSSSAALPQKVDKGKQREGPSSTSLPPKQPSPIPRTNAERLFDNADDTLFGGSPPPPDTTPIPAHPPESTTSTPRLPSASNTPRPAASDPTFFSTRRRPSGPSTLAGNQRSQLIKGTSSQQPRPDRRVATSEIKVIDGSASGSALSTKQRLALGATAPMPPRALGKAVNSGVVPVGDDTVTTFAYETKATRLRINTKGSTSGGVGDSTLASLNAGPSPSSPTYGSATSPTFADPARTFLVDSTGPHSPDFNMDGVQVENDISMDFAHAPAVQSAASDLLAEIMPAAFVAPLEPSFSRRVSQDAVNSPTGEHVPTGVGVKSVGGTISGLGLGLGGAATPIPLKIPKKFKWTGPLMATVRGNDVRLCDVTVGEAKTITSHSQSGSTPSTSSSIPWNIALSSEQQVLHVQMYDIMHIEEILHACKPATQLAYVHVEDGEDHSRSREVLLGYGNLMEQKEMGFISPLMVDKATSEPNALLVILPLSLAKTQFRTTYIAPPSNIDRPATMVAFLHVWDLISEARTEARNENTINEELLNKLGEYRGCRFEHELSSSDALKQEKHNMETPGTPSTPVSGVPDELLLQQLLHNPDPTYQLAVRVLNYPLQLHRFMQGSSARPYLMWDGRAPHGSNDPLPIQPLLFQSQLLKTILDHYPNAENVGHFTSVRVLFIHVGNLRNLSTLPGLADRRKKLDEMFVTYGSDPDIEPRLWGMREVYPVGGLVTFTASALGKQPLELLQAIENIAEHPLWSAYVLPSVVGMAAKVGYPNLGADEILAVQERGEFMFDFLLHAIVDRTLILMRAPPDDCEPMGRREVDFERQVFRDSRVDWLNHELAFVSDSPLQILAACLSDFEERYTKISERDWNSHMDLELFEEMDAMQTQFHMMTSFRRFIVLTEKESSLPVKEGGGLEWIPVSEFKFQDDFDQSHQIISS